MCTGQNFYSCQYIPIDTLVVTLRADYLWSEIIWRTTERPSNVRNFFGEPKIGNLEMSVSVQ